MTRANRSVSTSRARRRCSVRSPTSPATISQSPRCGGSSRRASRLVRWARCKSLVASSLTLLPLCCGGTSRQPRGGKWRQVDDRGNDRLGSNGDVVSGIECQQRKCPSGVGAGHGALKRRCEPGGGRETDVGQVDGNPETYGLEIGLLQRPVLQETIAPGISVRRDVGCLVLGATACTRSRSIGDRCRSSTSTPTRPAHDNPQTTTPALCARLKETAQGSTSISGRPRRPSRQGHAVGGHTQGIADDGTGHDPAEQEHMAIGIATEAVVSCAFDGLKEGEAPGERG